MKMYSYLIYKNFLNALANETRFRIIDILRKGEMNVKDLCKKTGFEQSRISHNLKRLENKGFISCKCKGKQRIYFINKDINLILKKIDKHLLGYKIKRSGKNVRQLTKQLKSV